jgi:hypothetical protein
VAPINPNNTPRFRAHYTTIGHQHSVQLRSAGSPFAIGVFLGSYFDAFGLTAADITVDFVDWAPAGSDVFNPVTVGIEGTTYTGDPAAVDHSAAWAYTFIGRTSGGKRVRMAQFGALYLGTDYRFIAGESSPLDNVINILQGAGSLLLGIDGLTPLWKDYCDVQVNDHWVKRLRP